MNEDVLRAMGVLDAKIDVRKRARVKFDAASAASSEARHEYEDALGAEQAAWEVLREVLEAAHGR